MIEVKIITPHHSFSEFYHDRRIAEGRVKFWNGFIGGFYLAEIVEIISDNLERGCPKS